MDYTKVPRELIYKDLDHLEDFNIGNRYSLNGQLYNMVRRYLFVEMGRNDYRTILLYILNEAYYLTTMLLMDDNADNDDVFNVYIKSILKDSPYPDEISSILRRLTMAICYINLERPSTESLKVRTIRRHLRNHAFEFIYLNSEISDYEHPDSKLFKPVALTEELLEQVKWRDLTDNFRPEIIKDFLDYLGESKKEKRLLIKSMYLQLTNSGEMYSVPYSVDSLLASRYREAGGRIWDLLSIRREEIDDEELNKMVKLLKEPDTYKMLYNQLRQNTRIEGYEREIRELKQRNRLLEEKLNEMNLKYEQQHAIATSQNEKNRVEEDLRGRIRVMKKIIEDLQSKMGNKAIQLKYIVESIKNKADFAGLKEAYYQFEQIDLMLYEEPVWRENRSELVEFFKERNKAPEKAGVVFMDNHGTVNNN